MPATFIDLHKIQRRVIKALETLEREDSERVMEAVLALYGKKSA